MKIKLLLLAVVGTALLATAAKDPVLMTVNGKDVHLSEFEYLYNKNKKQQIEPESLSDYVQRFINFKLKVADAEAEKIDQEKSFKNELNGYEQDLLKPFLEDTTVTERLAHEAYDRATKIVDVDHIMLPLAQTQEENNVELARLDSLRNCLLAGENIDTIAKKYSIDRRVHYGFITTGIFPYKWEYEAFNTPVGQMCKPFRTDFGNHLIRVNAVKPNPGQVEVEHILLLFPRGADAKAKASVKVRIDSIYAALKAGANFEQLAREKSQDPGSAKNGGKLPWFGFGRMVAQFQDVSFALNDGEMSQPFETDYGYHIVKKLAHKPVSSYAELEKDLKRSFAMDERADMPREAKVEEIVKKYNAKVNPDFNNYVSTELAKHGKYDSTFVADVLGKSNFTIFTFGKGIKVPAKEIVSRINPKAKLDNKYAAAYVASAVEPYMKQKVVRYYTDNILAEDANYRNLIQEYRDGLLLFDVSNRKVWEGAGKDTTGLKRYFEANRAKYAWDQPRFKGIILSAQGDSVMNAVKAAIPTYGADTLSTALHKRFGSKIKMERMLFHQGENKVVDYLCFKGEKPANNGKNYTTYMILEGGVIDQPQNVDDVKGVVTSDYSDVLEKQWIKELHSKYKVSINQKVLKELEKKYGK